MIRGLIVARKDLIQNFLARPSRLRNRPYCPVVARPFLEAKVLFSRGLDAFLRRMRPGPLVSFLGTFPGTRPIGKRFTFSAHRRRNPQSMSDEKEDAMHRILASAMILWLAAVGAANAQMDPAQTNPAQTNPQAAPAPENTVPATPSATTLQSVPASDPLSVPTSTVPTTFAVPAPGSSSGSGFGISAPASVNPQTAVQLPGEARNSSTQAPNTTASAPAASSNPPPCSATIPTTTGGASVGGLFGGGASGC